MRLCEVARADRDRRALPIESDRDLRLSLGSGMALPRGIDLHELCSVAGKMSLRSHIGSAAVGGDKCDQQAVCGIGAGQSQALWLDHEMRAFSAP